MKNWISISDPAAVRAFLNERGRMVSGPHRFERRICHWPYCVRCGLIALKNPVTRKAMSSPCIVEE